MRSADNAGPWTVLVQEIALERSRLREWHIYKYSIVGRGEGEEEMKNQNDLI